MMYNKTILATIMFVSLSLGWYSELYPQAWSAPENEKNFYTDKVIQDFSYAGYHYGEREIPSIEDNVIDVTESPYFADNSGSTDATEAIQSAINDAIAVGGGVVYLPEGTYRVTPGDNYAALTIWGANVVLRGAGAGKTFILNTQTYMRYKRIIHVTAPGSVSWTEVPSGSPVAYFSSDLMGPSKAIPVSSVSGFQTGDWVVLKNDIGDAWFNEHNETEWIGYGNNFPGMIYLRKIDSIDVTSKVIYVDIPTRYAMKTRDNSRIYKAGAMTTEVGVEYLSIGNLQNNSNGWAEEDYKTSTTGAYAVHGCYAIEYSHVTNGWVRGVHSFQPSQNSSTAHLLSSGLLLNQSRSITVDSCYFSHPQFGGGGGNGYMYRLEGQENLLTNNEAVFARHGYVFSKMHASGNVFLNCLDKDGGKQTGLSGSMNTDGSGSDHHMHFSHSNLFDGCTVENSALLAAYRPYGSTPKHNLTAAHSLYWNIRGEGSWGYSVHTQQSRYGYVIGTWGASSGVRTSAVGNSAYKTDPVDHVEGVGAGQSLEPQSLYQDQLARRLANKGTVKITAPADGDCFYNPAELQLTAEGTAASGIRQVTFLNRSDTVAVELYAPYSYTWNAPVIGRHDLTAILLSEDKREVRDNVTIYNLGDPLDESWNSDDIGSGSNNGYSGISGDTLSLSSAGGDIWGTADQFHYQWKVLNGDGSITARFLGQDTTHAFAKAGVMIRQSRDSSSAFAMTDMTPLNGMRFSYRTAFGDSVQKSIDNIVNPTASKWWMRLERSGDTVRGLSSADGITWDIVDEISIALDDSVLIGIAVSSHDAVLVNHAFFDNVNIEQELDAVPITKVEKKEAAALGNIKISRSSLSFTAPAGICVVSLFAPNGRLLVNLYEGQLSVGGKQTINLSEYGLSKGIVFVRIETPFQQINRKILLQ